MWIIRKRINLPSERAIFLFVDKMVPQSRSEFFRIYLNESHSIFFMVLEMSNTVYLVGQWVNCIPNIRMLMVFFTLPILGKTLLEIKVAQMRFLWLLFPQPNSEYSNIPFAIVNHNLWFRNRNLIQKNAISARVSCSLFTRSFFFEKLIWLSLVYDSKYVMSHTLSSHNLKLYWLFVRVNSLYIRVFHAVTLW